MQYRKEIDGLRAIAVLPVILFHGDFSGFSGGYIGVDIFFVISGYLITSIIVAEISKQQFSLINFYERRARRILPALSLVLLFTTIAAFILMPADLLKSYSQSLVSVATFSSNIFFYLTSGYFSTVSDEKPLLHTWSLAVEEQYYIFFPILLMLLWSAGKKNIISILVVISLISLFLSQYLSTKGWVDENFYLIFSRAWELLFGSLVAFMNLKTISTTKLTREIIGLLGLLLILVSILFFDAQTPFPSFFTLTPVLGTCFIIIFGKSDTFVGRFLSTRLFVSVGLISYSLYLWHQPLFAFLRLKTIGEPSTPMLVSAIIATFILSYLSYRFIEKPFRSKTSFNRKAIFQYSAASIILVLSVGLSGHLYQGFQGRFANNIYTETIQPSPKRKECHTKGADYLSPDVSCRYFENNVTWASFGDSHIVEPTYALSKILEQDGKGLLHLSFSGCPPALLFEVKQPGCSKWIKESLVYLETNDSIKNIILGFRHSAYLFGDQLDSYPGLPNENPNNLFSESFRSSTAEGAREIYWESFFGIITRLLKSGKTELPTNSRHLL
ncbi:acyltransferase family protein [Sedimenticola selenatireducens]|uniref:Acyltransferase n=1 Tax=Sedimenticola selenatireducens TaxID=191960 RepID=A0A557SBY5_9GAMM|nr:acyltransferase family protein [Sedimenticola selenatireducens]TVO74821.1 acyltransferase [Sedimenticola selenatireducens]TVT62356.1 MAG: acyltransferase [Sedimenticola selenatireducens]